MRTLLPYYFISTRIVGWQCSQCQRIFRLAVGESVSSNEPLKKIRRQFREHKCNKPPEPGMGA